MVASGAELKVFKLESLHDTKKGIANKSVNSFILINSTSSTFSILPIPMGVFSWTKDSTFDDTVSRFGGGLGPIPQGYGLLLS